MALAGNPTWVDLRVNINVRAEDDDALGIVFRYQDSRNYYRLSMDAMRSYRRLVKVTDGVLTVLWEDSNPYSVGVDFEVAVDAVGSRLRALHNGSELFSLVDEDHPQGRVGLYAWGHEDVRFNSVRVTRATLEVATLFMDHFDDGQISEWTFIDNGTFFSPSQWAVTGGSLQQSSNIFGGSTSATDPEKEGTYAVAGDTAWTDVVLSLRLSSGDDDAIGVMFRYTDNDNYYRFSMDQQRAYRRLVSKEGGGFRVIWEDAFQYEIDREYELVIAMRGEVIEAFLDGILMFRVRDAQHAAGSIALYSWANTDATFSDVRVYAAGVLSQQFALQDDFGTLRDGAYEFQDEGEIDGPSSWTVANGALLQTTAIRSADTLAATGSNAIRTELVAANFRVSASMSSSGGGAMGIVFRSSSQGYYRFAIDSDQQTRYLLKKVGSAFTVLFSEGFAVQQGTEYMLTVVCMNSQLTGFINGVQIFSVSDDSHSQGAVGLYVANNPNVAFGYLEVVIPEWLTYYRFGEEAAVPAGRRFRVISGSPTEPNIAEPLEAVRHVASSPLHESVLLTDGFTELRVVGPEGPSHRREFVPDSEFTPVAIRLLRRADGTSYVLIPDGGGSFAEGDYRCRLEYRRDGPGQVLSEAGETSSEVVQIDIPWRGTLT
jgi:hypothetical protein